jgi:hypothetical protein
MKTGLAMVIFLAVFAAAVRAQQAPHLSYVYPAGGRQGSTFTVVAGGQYFFSHTNFNVVMDSDLADCKVIAYDRPLRPDEQQALKEEMNKFQDKRKSGIRLTEPERARLEEVKTKLTRFGRRPANPALSEFMTLQFTLATNAEPGDHEIRVLTPGGLSNPLKFCVGTLPESSKPDWKALPKERASTSPELPAPVDKIVRLPVTINGQAAPASADRYHFWARQGQQIILATEARRLMPYIADAVPGWFEAALTIRDSKGKEVASAERYRFRPDPVVHFNVPRDGTYTVEIHDSLYRGREDFIYRLTIGELPFVTSIFPLGGKIGDQTAIELTGWNLPENILTLDNSAAEPGVISIAGKFFNAVPFALDALPEIQSRATNHSSETAQVVMLPVIVNGRITRPGEQDVFRFDGRAGQRCVAEVLARRLDSPLDSYLRLTDAKGKQIAFNDDFEDKSFGLETHHADSYLMATLPENGTYFVHLGDTQGQGGPEFAYRLRLSEPRPDFALRLVPSSLSIRAGMSVPVTAVALRRDGFTNAIDLELRNAPPGFSLSGARIKENQEKEKFTLKATAQPSEKPVSMFVEGHAQIGGSLVTHDAVPAEDLMQAFIYQHLVASKALDVIVNGQARNFNRNAFKILTRTPVLIRPGEKTLVKVGVPSTMFTERFRLELSSASDGILLESVSPVDNGIELALTADANKLRPGASGNLIVNVIPKNLSISSNPKQSAKQPQRPAVATLPAIPFRCVGD